VVGTAQSDGAPTGELGVASTETAALALERDDERHDEPAARAGAGEGLAVHHVGRRWLALTADPVSIAVEPVRVDTLHREVARRHVAAVQIREAGQAEVGIARVAVRLITGAILGCGCSAWP